MYDVHENTVKMVASSRDLFIFYKNYSLLFLVLCSTYDCQISPFLKHFKLLSVNIRVP